MQQQDLVSQTIKKSEVKECTYRLCDLSFIQCYSIYTRLSLIMNECLMTLQLKI